MKISYLNKFLLIIISCIYVSSGYADSLGRIFTSAEERQKLEKIRSKTEEKKIVVIEEVKKIEEPIVKKEIVYRDSIALKGFVHRNGGKSTAWINDTNTFDGNLDSQLIQVPDKNIKTDHVMITLPDDNTNIELRVGEAFTPAPIERDSVNTEDTM